jgi:hypothetical protein
MELARPFALVVLGGLVSTTLVTLVLLPALQLWLPGGDPAPDLLAPADAAPFGHTSGGPASAGPSSAGLDSPGLTSADEVH